MSFRSCNSSLEGATELKFTVLLVILCTTCPTYMHTGSGDLRLVEGNATSSPFMAGRLEVFINGEWGTICSDGFGSAEADVACQQLGYSAAAQYGNNLG